MKNKKGLKILAICGAVVLIGICAAFAEALLGNPVSKYLAGKHAAAYLEEHYSDTGYAVTETSFNFKFHTYHSHIKISGKPDRDFTLTYDSLGRLQDDDYEYRVKNRENTLSRLETDYRALADAVMEREDLPGWYEFGYGSLRSREEGKEALDSKTLELDKTYDTAALGEQYGNIVVVAKDETEPATVQAAAEMMQYLDKELIAAGIPYRWMEISLRGSGDGGNLYVTTFPIPREDIRSDTLADRVEESRQRFNAQNQGK